MAMRIKKARITFISLVPKGANQIPVIYKSDEGGDQTFEFSPIVKADMDKGEITAIVYAPELRDSQGHIASAEVIKQMAHDALGMGLKLDIRHDLKPVSPERASIAESFIVQKGDSRFVGLKNSEGKEFDAEGSWAVVIKIHDPQLRADYREGKWEGVSMFGKGDLAIEKQDNDDSMILRVLRKLFAPMRGEVDPKASPDTGVLDMTEAELKKMMDQRDEELKKSLTSIVTKAMSEARDAEIAKEAGVEDGDSDEIRAAKITLFKAGKKCDTSKKDDKKPIKKEDEKAAAPKFTGDPTDAKAVAQFAYEVKKAEILAKMDPSNPESVRTVGEELATLKKEFEGNGGEPTPTDTPEVARLKAELAKARGASNQPAQTPPANNGGIRIVGETLSKEGQQALKEGNDIANLINRQRGVKTA